MCKQGTEKEITLTDGNKKSCDECIQPLVQALNDHGLQTIASCCGHDKQPRLISLKSGEEKIFTKNYKEARMIGRLYPPLHWWSHGNWKYKFKMKLARYLLS